MSLPFAFPVDCRSHVVAGERPSGPPRAPGEAPRRSPPGLPLGLALGFFAAGIGAVGGCGLVSSDIATLSFDLPERHYVFDTAAWNLPMATLPAVPCTSDAMCCSAALALGYDCTKGPALVCDTPTAVGACAVKLPVEPPPQIIDLGMQVSELSSLNGQTLASVSISQISYDVVSSLNIDLPPVELFLAPQNVTSAADPMAQKFGTVPATPKNATISGGKVALEPNSEAIFSSYARNFKTPFQFLSRTVVTIRGGDTTPMGKVDIKVRGKVSARPTL
jgi:hypothetical protein